MPSASTSSESAAAAAALAALVVLGPAAAAVGLPEGSAPALRGALALCGGCPLWTSEVQPHPLNPGSGGANAVALSPDGRFLAVTGSSDGDAVTVLYLAASGFPLWTAAEPRDGWAGFEEGADVAFASDGARLFVTGHAAKPTPATFARDALTGTVLWRSPVRGEVLAVTSDGTRVLVAGRDGLLALDAATGEQLWRAPGVFSGVAVTPDGAAAVAIRSGFVVAAFEVADGSPRWETDYDVPIEALNRAELPAEVAVDDASGRAYVGGSARLWHLHHTEALAVLAAFDVGSGAVVWGSHAPGAAGAVAHLPGLVVLGGSDEDGRLAAWAHRSGDGALKWRGTAPAEGHAVALAANAAGTAVYAGGARFDGASAERRLAAFDAADGRLVWSALPVLGSGAVLDLAAGPEDAVLYATGYQVLGSGYSAYRTSAHVTAEPPTALR